MRRINPSFLLLLAAILITVGCAHERGGRAALRRTHTHNEVSWPGVVLIALGVGSQEHIAFRKFARELIGWGGGAADWQASRDLTSVQLEIAAKAAEVGPVVLLVRDAGMEQEIRETCGMFGDGKQLCKALAGRIRFRVTSHEGPWIRDYGPQVFYRNRQTVVVDAKYSGDPRSIRSIARTREEWNEQRFALLQQEKLVLDRGEFASASLKERIKNYEGLIAASSDPSLNRRSEDDESFTSIARAVLSPRRLALRQSKLALEGGNLLRLDDGRCLTTSDLMQQNESDQETITRTLVQELGCRGVIFLEPLPGEVIKHVDMFVLPVRGKRVLLASYDVDGEDELERYYMKAPPEIRQAIQGAADAMRTNKTRLTELGYDVTDVPALPPEVDDSQIWYATILNALVHVGPDGRRQVIAPSYEGRFDELQKRGQEAIKSAFGAEVRVEFVESTVAAKLQGAVHCLTIVVPEPAAALDDPTADADKRVFAALDRRIKEAASLKGAGERLTGQWHTQEIEVEFTFRPDGQLIERSGETETSYRWEVTHIIEASVDQKSRYDLTVDGQHVTITWIDGSSFDLAVSDGTIVHRFVRGPLPDRQAVG